jgi:plasmid stabilization system protein ParE
VTATLVVQPEAESISSTHSGGASGGAPGWATSFLDEVSHTFGRIAEHPTRYALVHRLARRALLRRFPYATFYVARGERVFVLAVLHQRRSPRIARTRATNFKPG